MGKHSVIHSLDFHCQMYIFLCFFLKHSLTALTMASAGVDDVTLFCVCCLFALEAISFFSFFLGGKKTTTSCEPLFQLSPRSQTLSRRAASHLLLLLHELFLKTLVAAMQSEVPGVRLRRAAPLPE
jgi:hypothetical protein